MVTNLCIDPIYNCNENCISCRCNHIANYFKSKLTIEDYYNIIKEFKKCDGKEISIFGGEPLLFPQIFEIIKYSKENNLRVSISTNGILLKNDIICEKLAESNIDKVVISVMGVHNRYNYMHGKKAFDTLFLALKTLIQKNSLMANKISIHMTLQRKNYNELPNVVNFAAKLGINHVSCQYVSVVSKEDDRKTELELKEKFFTEISHWELPDDLLVTKEQLNELFDSINIAKEMAIEKNIELYIDPMLMDKLEPTRLLTGKCNPKGKCNLCDLIILPDGKVGACAMLQHFVIGNIRKQTMADIVSSKKLIKLKERVENGFFLPICSSCCRHAMFF